MALEGSLKEFGLADILQLIYYQRKTGVLTVESTFDRVRLLFYEGNIVFAESGKHGETRIGRILVKKGLVTEKELGEALEEQKKTGARLGSVLLKNNCISRDELKETLTSQFTELVSYLFTWRQGHYEFRPQGVPIDKDVPISLDTQQILMEGLRILDEWSLVEGKITLESVFCRTQVAAEGLSPEEQEVIRRIDGECDVSEIASLTGLDNFQTSKALLSLFEKGAIEKKKAPEETKSSSKAGRKLPALFLEGVFAFTFVVALVVALSGNYPRKSKAFQASEELDRLRSMIEVYKTENGQYPDKLEKIANMTDPWGNYYYYSAASQTGFTLFSFGPDGTPNSGDEVY